MPNKSGSLEGGSTTAAAAGVRIAGSDLPLGIQGDGAARRDGGESEGQQQPSIAYVTTIAFCASGKLDPSRRYSYVDAPSLLAHSIHRQHARSSSRYRSYRLYAIVHPQAHDCAKDYLRDYTIILKDVPVRPEEVQTPTFQYLIRFGSGCCGAREFLKLYAYNLTQHSVVVHFDSDSLLLQSLDELYDSILYHNRTDVALMRGASALPESRVDAFLTRDYIQRNPYTDDPKLFAVQGGFFVIRPDASVLEEMIQIIRKGDYTVKGGWGGSKIGKFYGAAQIQGFLAYYYSILHPQHYAELNRCLYNSMIYDEPRICGPGQKGDQCACRTAEAECEDCRITPLANLKSVHFTTCQKPWSCTLPEFGNPPEMCRTAQNVWFQYRQELERQWGQDPPRNLNASDHTLGYCPNGVYKPLSFPTNVL